MTIPDTIDCWTIVTTIYCILTTISFIPVACALRRPVMPKDVARANELAREAFSSAKHFNDEQKLRLELHFARLAGTLVFWKNNATKFKRFHYYCLIWTIPSAVVIPILTQSIDEGNGAKTLVTVVSAVTAVLLAFHKGFKVEDNYKAFRHGESEYYDLYRRVLDLPEQLGSDGDEQIRIYFDETEKIRRLIRNAETNNLATVDDARTMLQGKDKDAKGDNSPTR